MIRKLVFRILPAFAVATACVSTFADDCGNCGGGCEGGCGGAVATEGGVVEAGGVERVVKAPQHPYTQLLVSSILQG